MATITIVFYCVITVAMGGLGFGFYKVYTKQNSFEVRATASMDAFDRKTDLQGKNLELHELKIEELTDASENMTDLQRMLAYCQLVGQAGELHNLAHKVDIMMLQNRAFAKAGMIPQSVFIEVNATLAMVKQLALQCGDSCASLSTALPSKEEQPKIESKAS